MCSYNIPLLSSMQLGMEIGSGLAWVGHGLEWVGYGLFAIGIGIALRGVIQSWERGAVQATGHQARSAAAVRREREREHWAPWCCSHQCTLAGSVISCRNGG